MKIHINRAGQSLGQFLPDEVRKGFNEGKFFADDLAWQDGMAMWKPLGEVLDLVAPASGENEAAPLVPTPPESDGPEWEQRDQLGFFKALFDTIHDVLLEPTATFSRMKLRGGFGAPLVFFLIFSMVGAIATEFYKIAFRSFGGLFLQGEQAHALMAQMGTTSESLGALIIMPIIFVIGVFLGAGVLHICLMLVGGANRPFEATFRVMAYTGGAVALLNLVPGCGMLIGMVWGFIVEIIGLSEVQKISKGRAALAVLLPLIVCFGLILLGLVVSGIAFWPSIMEAFKK